MLASTVQFSSYGRPRPDTGAHPHTTTITTTAAGDSSTDRPVRTQPHPTRTHDHTPTGDTTRTQRTDQGRLPEETDTACSLRTQQRATQDPTHHPQRSHPPPEESKAY